MDVKFMVAVTEASEAAKEETSIISKITAAMRVTVDHWMLTDEDLRFKAAIAGVLDSNISPEETDLLMKEMKALNSLSDFLSGNMTISSWEMSQVELPKKVVGLMQYWIVIKEEEGKK